MKRKRSVDEQIIGILDEQEAGAKCAALGYPTPAGFALHLGDTIPWPAARDEVPLAGRLLIPASNPANDGLAPAAAG